MAKIMSPDDYTVSISVDMGSSTGDYNASAIYKIRTSREIRCLECGYVELYLFSHKNTEVNIACVECDNKFPTFKIKMEKI